MLYLAFFFLLLSLLAGLLGFGVIAFAGAEFAKICFFLFLAFFFIALVGGAVRRVP